MRFLILKSSFLSKLGHSSKQILWNCGFQKYFILPLLSAAFDSLWLPSLIGMMSQKCVKIYLQHSCRNDCLCFSVRSEKLSGKLWGKPVCSDLSATVLTRYSEGKQNNIVLLSCHTASVLGSYQFGKATTNTLPLYQEQFSLMRNSKKIPSSCWSIPVHLS